MTAIARPAPPLLAQPDDIGPLPPRARARRLRRRLRRDPARRAPATTSSTTALDRPAQPRAPRRHRRRARTGDGAGILIQVPDAFLRDGRRLRRCPPPARTPSGIAFLPADDAERRRDGRARSRQIAAEEGLDGPRLARRAGRRRARSAPGRPRRACRASASCSSPPAAGRVVGHRPRPAAPSACASAPSTRPTSTSRRCRPAPSSTRACSPPASSSRSSPTCPTSASQSALALVHSRFSTNTFPSLAAGPPVPLHRPQRRDQHREGQPQLDAAPARRSWPPT